MKKYSTLVSALVLGASLVFTGCGSSSDSDDEMHDHEEEQLLFFYDSVDGTLYSYNTEDGDTANLTAPNTVIDSSDIDEDGAQIVFWPHNTPNGLVDKYLFLSDDAFDDQNLTHDEILYAGPLGDFDHVHIPGYFDPDSVGTQQAKNQLIGAVNAMNAHLLAQKEIEEEIEEAIENDTLITGNLCNFFVPTHEEHEEEEEGHEEEEEHEETPHYAITTDGLVHVFMEGESGLTTHTRNITLTGADSCVANESGFASAGDHGVYVYSNDSKALHLVDEHGGAYHQHGTPTPLNEILPTGVSATQMIGTAGGEAEHEHE